MPKAYWITCYREIKDADKVAAYAKLAGPALAPLGARYLCRGTAERDLRGGREGARRRVGVAKPRAGDRRT